MLDTYVWFVGGFVVGLFTFGIVLLGLKESREKPLPMRPCRCGCGRMFSGRSGWDGYHGG